MSGKYIIVLYLTVYIWRGNISLCNICQGNICLFNISRCYIFLCNKCWGNTCWCNTCRVWFYKIPGISWVAEWTCQIRCECLNGFHWIGVNASGTARTKQNLRCQLKFRWCNFSAVSLMTNYRLDSCHLFHPFSHHHIRTFCVYRR